MDRWIRSPGSRHKLGEWSNQTISSYLQVYSFLASSREEDRDVPDSLPITEEFQTEKGKQVRWRSHCSIEVRILNKLIYDCNDSEYIGDDVDDLLLRESLRSTNE